MEESKRAKKKPKKWHFWCSRLYKWWEGPGYRERIEVGQGWSKYIPVRKGIRISSGRGGWVGGSPGRGSGGHGGGGAPLKIEAVFQPKRPFAASTHAPHYVTTSTKFTTTVAIWTLIRILKNDTKTKNVFDAVEFWSKLQAEFLKNSTAICIYPFLKK